MCIENTSWLRVFHCCLIRAVLYLLCYHICSEAISCVHDCIRPDVNPLCKWKLLGNSCTREQYPCVAGCVLYITEIVHCVINGPHWTKGQKYWTYWHFLVKSRVLIGWRWYRCIFAANSLSTNGFLPLITRWTSFTEIYLKIEIYWNGTV